MVTQVTVLTESVEAPLALSLAYTSDGVTTMLDKWTVHNTTAAPIGYTLHLVAPGDAPGATNVLVQKTILPGTVYRCPEVVGHVLAVGGSAHHTGSAVGLNVRASGREVA